MNLGMMAAAGSLLAHPVYGAVLGAFHRGVKLPAGSPRPRVWARHPVAAWAGR